jgi:eukaryotic-like serine/threonine-protein kinase
VSEGSRGQYAFGQFRMDLAERLLTCRSLAVPLPPKAFDLLALLVQHAGRLVEKECIIQALWPKTFVEEANVANLIGLLRKTLGDSPEKPEFIQTVPKRGYRFVATMSQAERAHRESRAGSETRGQAGIRIIAFPFRSDDAGYLAYGLPEAIAATLAEFSAFTVRSTQLAARFDPLRWDPKTVAAEADVDVILRGSLARAGERIRATAELLDAPSATIIWSRKWDIPVRDLFRLHNGVVQLIIRSLAQRTHKNGDGAISRMDTPAAPDAYELYLRANQLMLQRSSESMSLARDLYFACTELDPDYAPAWARLGRCYRWLEKFGAPAAGIPGAAEAAFHRAFQLNPHLAIAHSAYTPIQCDAGQAREAMVRLLKTLERNENNPEIFAALVHACRYCGQLDASVAAHERAFRLDRELPTSVSHTYFALCDYSKALFWYETKSGFYLDAAALASMGRLQEASALLWTRRERFQMQPGLMKSLQGFLEDDPTLGLAALRDEAPRSSGDPEVCFYLARQAARFGDLALAHDLLSQSVDRGYCCSYTLVHDAWFERLRATAEFEQTLAIVRAREEASRRAFMEAGGDRLLGPGSETRLA